MIEVNFIETIENRYKEYWELPAFTNYGEDRDYTFADLSKWVAKVHLLLKHSGISKGDKVALVGNDCAEWCMTWMGVITYGAVVVPILPEFHKDDIQHIINHSDSQLVFVGERHVSMLAPTQHPEVKHVFRIKDLSLVKELSINGDSDSKTADQLFNERYPNGFGKEDVTYPKVDNSEVVLISYTSGTSGFSKGVMATANNLMANLIFGHNADLLHRGEKGLCFLPNAHAYSCAFNFLLAQTEGTHLYILTSKPTPKILLKALQDVKPSLILTVPLILEKIYKNAIQPKLNNPYIRVALKLPIVNELIHRKFKDSLTLALGGNFTEVIVGGAALNPEVENFLLRIGFPLTVGYGMTECSPIISYTNHKTFSKRSAGKILHDIEEVRVDSPKRIKGKMVGEIQVKGENVCQGYYKNEEATSGLFTPDGWLHTGDLGYIENDYVYLKGRSKAMLLGSDGQNIYPEEIEAKLAMQPFVNDAIVVQRGKKIVAIVELNNDEMIKSGYKTTQEVKWHVDHIKKEVNANSPLFAQIADIEVLEGVFEKTPKQSIKRYLYH